jgi:myo-inositol 2-dehydrogenase/D-chiro-inositol 1-dehydrogenase
MGGAGERRIRLGIVGAGSMGSQHARNAYRFVSGCELVALQDLDRARAERLASELGRPRVFDTPSDLVASADVDAVLVASPDATHAAIVLACLARGLPVLCEKPLASTLDDALGVVRAEARIGGRLVSVGFMRRFDPAHAALREAAASGAIGRPLLWKGVHRNAKTPYDSSGPFILANSSGHDIDSARWLLGAEVAEVSVRGLRSSEKLPEGSRDLLLVQMTMADGRFASAELFMSADYGYEVSAELVGQLGVASTAQPERFCLRSKGFRGTPVTSDWTAPFQEAYLSELAEWIDSLREGRPFSGASAWDGYAAVAATTAAGASLMEGSPKRVELVERPAFYG